MRDLANVSLALQKTIHILVCIDTLLLNKGWGLKSVRFSSIHLVKSKIIASHTYVGHRGSILEKLCFTFQVLPHKHGVQGVLVLVIELCQTSTLSEWFSTPPLVSLIIKHT